MAEQTRSMGWWPALYEPFHALGARIADWFSPPSEAANEADAYVLDVELPGVAMEDVELVVDADHLILNGEKKSRREESGEGFLFSEIRYGRFSRSFRLPKDADPAKVDASMKEGVLTIRIGKTRTRAERRSIPIGG
ncbi:MAG: Hsp20/alpha crystallin family protein [Pseudomonadota bacterium]